MTTLESKREVERYIPEILSKSFRIAEIPKNWISYDLGTIGTIHRFTFYYYHNPRSTSRYKITIDSIESNYYKVLIALPGKERVELRGEMIRNIEKLTGICKDEIKHIVRVVSVSGEDYETS